MRNRVVSRGQLPAPWQDYAKAEENQRLAVIEERIERKNATFEELLAERRRIMRRCIKRKQRANGQA